MEPIEILEPMVKTSSSVLEVGCGDGSLMRALADKTGVFVVGVDPYAHGEGCLTLKGEEIDKLAEKFDLIYSVHSFHHLDSPKEFLLAAERVLGSGGRVVVIDWRYGAETGVPEKYYTHSELISILDDAEYIEIDYWVDGDNQILVSAPASRLRIAVACDGDKVSRKTFGRAREFAIFEVVNDKAMLVERRENPIASDNPPGKTWKIIDLLRDCQVFAGGAIGRKGEIRTKFSGRLFVQAGKEESAKELANKIILKLSGGVL